MKYTFQELTDMYLCYARKSGIKKRIYQQFYPNRKASSKAMKDVRIDQTLRYIRMLKAQKIWRISTK